MSTYPNTGSFTVTPVLFQTNTESAEPLGITTISSTNGAGNTTTLNTTDYITIDPPNTSYTVNSTSTNFNLSNATEGELTYTGTNGVPIEVTCIIIGQMANSTARQINLGAFVDTGSGYAMTSTDPPQGGSQIFANIPFDSSSTIVSKCVLLMNNGDKIKFGMLLDTGDDFHVYTVIITAQNFSA